MEECEVVMRGMPECSEHEWRHKGENVGCPDFGFCPVGSCSACGLFPYTRPSISKGKKKIIFYLDKNPNIFPWALFYQGLSVHA